MEVEYRDGYAYVDGLKFRRDTKSGYYLSTAPMNGRRVRLHRYIWTKYNGEIKKGYEVHHKDINKDNNEISNLELLSKKDHSKLHGYLLTDEQRKAAAKNLLEKAVPKSKAWHSSEEGKAWHSKVSKSIWDKKEERECECKVCKKKYFTRKMSKGNGCCSQACLSEKRRKSGLDDEVRTCAICKNEFTMNKYRKTKTCSRACSGKLRSLNLKSSY